MRHGSLAAMALGIAMATASSALASAGGEKAELLPAPAAPQIITALTTLIIFLLLLIVLSRFAWGPILAGLKAREEKIRKDIADAEATRARAEATLKEYEAQLAGAQVKAQAMLAEAVRQGEQMAMQIRARAQVEAEETRERALRDIEAARKQAVKDICALAADLSTSIAEKILRRTINRQDQEDLVRQGIEQLQASQR